jgi:hypothetical protein
VAEVADVGEHDAPIGEDATNRPGVERGRLGLVRSVLVQQHEQSADGRHDRGSVQDGIGVADSTDGPEEVR